MTGSSFSKGPVYAVAAAVLFGASTPLAKILLGEIDPILFAALLYLGSGTGVLLLGRFRRPDGKAPRELRLDARDYPWLTGAILTGGVLAPISLLYGLRATSAATASLLLNFELVATTLIAFFIFAEFIGRRVLAAIAVITVAGIILTWNMTGLPGFSPASLGIVAACALWGIDNNLTRKISGKDPLSIAVVKGMGAGGVSFLIAMLTRAAVPGFQVVAAALIVGFVTYGLSIVFFVRALRDLGATRTSAYFASAPFIGSIASLLLLREVPGTQFLIALPLFLLGVALLVSERHIPGHFHERIVHAHRHRHDELHDHPHPGEDTGEHVHEHVHEPVDHENPPAPDIHHGHER
ncbi:MAG TPA: EamA family transporter [Methanomicrobiales archaeon]|nr:EamA family transporter [Methanomicrobiales archaeon]